MALADKVTADKPKSVHGLPCSVGKLLAELPSDEAGALQQMMATGWSQSQIYRALVDEGYAVGAQTINRHRSRACRCFQ